MPQPVSIKREDRIAIISIDNPPVNALGAAVRSGLRMAAEEIAGADDVDAVVLRGEGLCFSAGADITEFGTEQPADVPTLPEAIAAIENLTVPVVAAVHGFAFGGGLELAMGAHYRIAAAGTKLGLPEVDLGIIPGAGGTQRLPRLTGLTEAARLIATGKRISAEAALQLGLIDEVGDDGIDVAKRLLADGKGPRPTSAMSTEGADLDPVRAETTKRTRGRTAPVRAIESVANAAALPFADGMKREREIFLELRDGPEARALRHLFRAEREAQKISDVPADDTPTAIETVGVVGFGTMGQGIALALAAAGIEVVAVEQSEGRLDAGLENVRQGLEDRVSRGRMMADEMDAQLALISGSTDLSDLADADLVIEAALEDLVVKKEIFAALDGICRPDAILATNTSGLDIDAIAAATSRPECVAGAHFFAPAQVMKLLELVRGTATAPATAVALMRLAKRIGKVGVCVGNGPRFVGNNMYHRYTWQAYFMLQEGASPRDIDTAMEAFGFPLGCLAVGDISGLDVAWAVRKGQVASGELGPDDPYPVVADRICEEGWLGRKTGRGWYRYDDGKKTDDAEVAALISSVSADLGIERRDIGEDEIQERCLFALINAGAHLLQAGIAQRPGDIDVIWRYGYGFPIWRGGPMHMADEMGLATVLGTLGQLEAAHGSPFTPAGLIRDRVAAGKSTFSD